MAALMLISDAHILTGSLASGAADGLGAIIVIAVVVISWIVKAIGALAEKGPGRGPAQFIPESALMPVESPRTNAPLPPPPIVRQAAAVAPALVTAPVKGKGGKKKAPARAGAVIAPPPLPARPQPMAPVVPVARPSPARSAASGARGVPALNAATLRRQIVLNEILGKPLALRDNDPIG